MTQQLKKNHKAASKEQGFTLVELSIVLVIIGLIVSGVLVGQDLIQAAQIRAQIRQVQDLDTALNTFRSKYNGLPGDLNNAFDFGLTTAASLNGNGDGIINGAVATATTESSQVFTELGNAQMVAGRYVSSFTPATKMGRGRIAPFSVSTEGLNAWALGATGSDTTATGNATVAAGTAFTGFESWSVDQRMDDGRPNSGIVRVAAVAQTFTGATTLDTARGAASATNCRAGAAVTDNYIIDVGGTTAVGNQKNCTIVMRISG